MKKLQQFIFFLVGIFLITLGVNAIEVNVFELKELLRQEESQEKNLGDFRVIYPNQGGTGVGTAPAYGQILVGNAGGAYTLTATSSLGITASETDPVWTAVSGNYLLSSDAFTQAIASTTFQPIIAVDTYDPYGQATSTITDHTTTYDHTNYNTAYTNRVDSWTYPLRFSGNTTSLLNMATSTITCTGSASCGAGSYVIGNGLTIAGTAYSAGNGLQLIGTTFSIDTTYPNTFSALQIFNGKASTTQLSISDRLYLGTGTTTASNGFNISDGCYAINGSCVGGSGGGGTVTSVAMSVPTGLSIAGSPITTDGTLALTFTGGYSIPTDLKQTSWDNKWDLASTTIGSAYGGTGSTSLSGILKGNGVNAIQTAVAGTDYYNAPGQIDHDQLLNFSANEHIDWTGASAGTIHATNYVDNNTTYTAGGTLLNLTGTVFSVNEGTLTNTDLCVYSDGTGLVCNTTDNSTNWDTAFGWGNHAVAGYLSGSAYYATTTHANIATLPALSITESQISDLRNYILMGTTSVDSITTLNNLVSVGTLTSGAIGAGFTAIGDSYISSAATWNAKQAGDDDLTALAALASTGLIARTGAATYSERTLATSTDKIIIANANGVAGNPTFDIRTESLILGTDVKAGTLTDTLYCTWDNGNSQIVCNSAGGSGGGGSNWSVLQNYGVSMVASTTPVWAAAGLYASSTSASMFHNTTDATSNEVARFYANTRATPLNNDQGYLSFYGETESGKGQQEFSRILWENDDVTGTTKDSTLRFYNQISNVLTDGMDLVGKNLTVNGSLTAASVLTANGRIYMAGGVTGGSRDISLRGSSATSYQFVLDTGKSAQTTSGNSMASVLLASGWNEGSGANIPLLSNLVIKATPVTANSATVSDTASLYIEGAATTTVVSGHNYSLWEDNVGGGGLNTLMSDTTIGTSSPSAKLTVWSNGSNGILEIVNTASTTLFGVYDDGSVVINASGSLVIPQGASPTVNAVGKIAFDTTDNQLLIGTSTAHEAVIRTNEKLFGFSLASTSPEWFSGGSLPIPPEKDGYIITGYSCYVTAGTSVVLTPSDGTNDMDGITCATTITTDTTIASNSTVTAGELMQMKIGAITGAVDYVSFTAFGTWTRE